MASLLPRSHYRLVARLPFGLDDTGRIGAAFRDWIARGPRTDGPAATRPPRGPLTDPRSIVEVWTYCTVRRYFASKFAQQPEGADRDALIGQAYWKIENGRWSMRHPDHYPHWVNVVCRNTFVNYLRCPRGRRRLVSLSDEATRRRLHAEREALRTAGPSARLELGLAHEVVDAAIDRLPAYLRATTRLYVLEGCSYREVEKRTQTPVATARSYVCRARRRLRAMPIVQGLEEDLL